MQSNNQSLQDSGLLVVFAMREEAQGHFEREGASVIYTGLGKVNATYLLAKELAKRNASGVTTRAVLNFGTAGSYTFKTHDVVECTGFVQRDMDVSPLGFAVGVTPFDKEAATIEVPKRLKQLPSGICGTGDSFETGQSRVPCHVVDMEAYALAKVCRFENIPFLSVKYITDGSDHNAHNDWAANLPHAAAKFIEVFREILAGRLFEGTEGSVK